LKGKKSLISFSEVSLLDTRRKSRIARLQANNQSIKGKPEIYLTADK